MSEDAESDIAIRFVHENEYRKISAKAERKLTLINKESSFFCCIELTVQQRNP